MGKAQWIWYPDDFEVYHNNRLTTLREQRNENQNPMWEFGRIHNYVLFYKIAEIDKPEKFDVKANGLICIRVNNGRKTEYKYGDGIMLKPGRNFVKVYVSKIDGGFPAIYGEGEHFSTDDSWYVSNFGNEDEHAGTNFHYDSPDMDPCEFFFKYKRIYPKTRTETDGGVLYDFGSEVMGKVILTSKKDNVPCSVYYGESKEEALDTEESVLTDEKVLSKGDNVLVSRACRYLFIKCKNELEVSMDFEYVDIKDVGSFSCSDKKINKLWKVCDYTMHLNMREGFYDGIKRDRWIWAGDAYQSFFVNSYLTNDTDIVRRTLTMMRGKDDLSQHINTIVDYSCCWIMNLWEYYFFTGDKEFLIKSYPKTFNLIDMFETIVDENGFIIGSKKRGDWTFIDWADMDKDGPVCALQMFMYRTYVCMAEMSKVIGDGKDKEFSKKAKNLKKNINKKFWDEEKGGFVSSFTSGKREIRRHANILAILFDVTTEERKQSIKDHVLYNDEVPAITTPYFKFFELDALCSFNDFDMFTDMLHSYWGAMLDLGATTIWEQFDPKQTGIEHYEMYGGKYCRSLCHAWGSSPIYLLGKYCLGVRPTSPGYETFEVRPNLLKFKHAKGVVPLGENNKISIEMKDGSIRIKTDKEGGTLAVRGQLIKIPANFEITERM